MTTSYRLDRYSRIAVLSVLLSACQPSTPPAATTTADPAVSDTRTVAPDSGAPRWVTPLPVPRTVMLGADTRLTLQAGVHDFGLPGRRTTPVWGYALPGEAATVPGPTLLAEAGTPVQVTFHNALPATPPFPIDTTSQPGPPMVAPHGNVIPHLHGGHTAAVSDGTPGQHYAGGQGRALTYDNDQLGATLWYHDHTMGLTRTNVYAGLAGFYLLHGPDEATWNLPWNDGYDLPLLLQDRTFNADGTLSYPARWEPEFFGNVAVVNGAAFPTATVEPRTYRLRLLNGSNARFYDLTLNAGGRAVVLNQIGVDGGLLPRTAPTTRLLLAPGERADVLVNFSALAGQTLTLDNRAGTPYDGTSDASGGKPPLPTVLHVRVGRTVTHPDRVVVPGRMTAHEPTLGTPDKTRYLTLNEEVDDATGDPQHALLGTFDAATGRPRPHHYHDPVTEAPALHATEDWVIMNTTEDAHPIHVHQVQFMVVERAALQYAGAGDSERLAVQGGAPTFGPARAPAANERGWKDTVVVYPGEMARIRMRFDRPGEYVWHCHILEHEENDMMRPILVGGDMPMPMPMH